MNEGVAREAWTRFGGWEAAVWHHPLLLPIRDQRLLELKYNTKLVVSEKTKTQDTTYWLFVASFDASLTQPKQT